MNLDALVTRREEIDKEMATLKAERATLQKDIVRAATGAKARQPRQAKLKV